MNYPQHTNCTFSFCSSAEWRQIRGLHEYDSRRCLIIVSTEEIYFAENRIDGVMVSVLASSVVDRGFIGGVIVSMFASCVVGRGFIGGVMVSVLASTVIDLGSSVA
jgi:coenzyme F420-reducing hydrogenase beta subunit